MYRPPGAGCDRAVDDCGVPRVAPADVATPLVAGSATRHRTTTLTDHRLAQGLTEGADDLAGDVRMQISSWRVIPEAALGLRNRYRKRFVSERTQS
jgi:hypothetical protein